MAKNSQTKVKVSVNKSYPEELSLRPKRGTVLVHIKSQRPYIISFDRIHTFVDLTNGSCLKASEVEGYRGIDDNGFQLILDAHVWSYLGDKYSITMKGDI